MGRGKATGQQGGKRDADEALQSCLSLHIAGRLDAAERAYRKVLRKSPRHVRALHLLGVLRFQAGDPEESLTLLQRAAKLSPDDPDVANDLGNVLHETGDLKSAERAYQHVVQLRPNDARAHSNLALVLRDQGLLDQALATCEKAVALDPKAAGSWQNLGNLFKHARRWEDAVRAYREVLRLAPEATDTYRNLLAVLRRSGRMDESQEVLAQWLQHEPDSATAKHLLASYGTGPTPAVASEDYVREVFNEFADSFDEELASLEYRGPELIRDAVVRAYGEPDKSLVILDAGCGTGACGEVLRPYAAHLLGVDLSEKMLERAGRLGLYDELAAEELTHFLRQRSDCLDLVSAADAFNYFGELHALLDSVAQSLRDAGRVIFTVEASDDVATDDPFQLHTHGRYTHRSDYVASALAESHFCVEYTQLETLRIEAGRPVPSLVVTAIKR